MSRGFLVDWSTQKWVQATGRRVDLCEHPWLAGPVGPTRHIGTDFFDRLATAEGLRVDRHRSGKGLLPSFGTLAGGGFDPAAVAPAVAEFYERAADFDIDVWSEWGGLVRPFGALVTAVFSRRLGQLNLPLSPLDSSWGMTSEVVQLVEPVTGRVRENAWVRTLVKTGQTLYVGSYSVATPPGADGPCVKTVFPLPNGNAVVLLQPHARPDGMLELVSEGRRFGDPGFYLAVHDSGGVRARYVKGFRERIRVYPAGGVVRADHTMSLWRVRCLHLHYRLRRRESRADAKLLPWGEEVTRCGASQSLAPADELHRRGPALASDHSARPHVSRRSLAALGLVLLCVACCPLGGRWLIPFQSEREESAEPFSTERWTAASADSPDRYRMLPRLLRDHRLVGLTPAEAGALLGPPTQRDVGPQGWGWFVYFLGHGADEFLDSWHWPHIILRFEEGRVQRVEQVTTWVGETLKPVIRQK